MNNFICKKCKHCSKHNESIVFRVKNKDIALVVCDNCSISIPRKELTEQEKTKLHKLLVYDAKNQLAGLFYLIRNRYYTDFEKEKEMLKTLKWKYVDQMKINDVSESCPFYAELFLLLENF